jgi:hypothetical protein
MKILSPRFCQQGKAELILRQSFDGASLAQDDILPAAATPPEKAQDDGREKP